jgi:hypothetical protein
MTDDALVYTNSRRFAEILAAVGAKHITPPPYTPRRNGKGRESHPHPPRRMGLRPPLAELQAAHASPEIIRPLLQPQAAPQQPRRPATHQPRSQRPRPGQLDPAWRGVPARPHGGSIGGGDADSGSQGAITSITPCGARNGGQCVRNSPRWRGSAMRAGSLLLRPVLQPRVRPRVPSEHVGQLSYSRRSRCISAARPVGAPLRRSKVVPKTSVDLAPRRQRADRRLSTGSADDRGSG